MLLIVQMLALCFNVYPAKEMALIRTGSLYAISIMTDFVATRRLLMHVCACSCAVKHVLHTLAWIMAQGGRGVFGRS